MEILTSKETNQYTVQLQGIGHVYGTPADQLKVGSTIIWNYGSRSSVIKILGKTKAFITVMLTDGERRLKKTRIVGRPENELPEKLQKRGEYPKDYQDTSDITIFFKVFPEYITYVEQECYALAYNILLQNLIKLPEKIIVEHYLKNNRSNVLIYKKYDLYNNVILPNWIKEDDIVTDCETVHEFAHKYRKPDRFTGRGEDYVNVVMDTHKQELREKGFTNISHHDCITGKHVVFVKLKK